MPMTRHVFILLSYHKCCLMFCLYKNLFSRLRLKIICNVNSNKYPFFFKKKSYLCYTYTLLSMEHHFYFVCLPVLVSSSEELIIWHMLKICLRTLTTKNLLCHLTLVTLYIYHCDVHLTPNFNPYEPFNFNWHSFFPLLSVHLLII